MEPWVRPVLNQSTVGFGELFPLAALLTFAGERLLEPFDLPLQILDLIERVTHLGFSRRGVRAGAVQPFPTRRR